MERLTHRQLCEIGAKWLVNVNNWIFRCQYAAVELVSSAMENPDVFGLRHDKPILIEVKVSKSDFKRDAFKRHKNLTDGMGATRYFLCPKGVISKEDITNGWGLLWYDAGKIEVVKESEFFSVRDYSSELIFAMSIIRRLQGNNKIIDFRTKPVDANTLETNPYEL